MSRRPPAFLILLLVVALAAGCGGTAKTLAVAPKDPAHQGTDDEAKWVGASLLTTSTTPGFDVTTQTCFGHSVIDELGKDAAMAFTTHKDQSTAEENAAGVAAMDECVTPAQLAMVITSAVASASGVTGIDLTELVGCLEDRLAGKVGATYEAFGHTDTPDGDAAATKSFVDLLDGCPTASITAQILLKAFIEERTDLPGADLMCIAAAMSLQVDLADAIALGANPALQAAYDQPMIQSIRSCGYEYQPS